MDNKTIKISDNIGWDTKGIVHERQSLHELLTPVILFESGGEENEVTLNDDYSKYSFIEIYSKETGGIILPVVKISKEFTGFTLDSVRSDSGGVVTFSKKYNVSSNKIKPTNSLCIYMVNNTINYMRTNVDYWRIGIVKVIGYK